MDSVQVVNAIILGLVQGLTEFIPVSSSGHLILVGHFLHFQYSGLAFDTAMDVGTLLALYIFFARDFWELARDVVLGGPKRKLGWLIIAATIPGVIAGVLIQHEVETVFRSAQIVAINLIWVGIVMWIVDRWAKQSRGMADINLPRALAVGIAQAVALIPGVSRSGITITTGRALGLDRVSATRFSFLLSAPIITGATLKVMLGGEALSQMALAPGLYAAGILAALVSGYLSIKFLIGYLSKHGLAVFAAYRVVVGLVIIMIGLK
jgi:undecaprenyl-diphosphatase